MARKFKRLASLRRLPLSHPWALPKRPRTASARVEKMSIN
jgi:hypothetical protein